LRTEKPIQYGLLCIAIGVIVAIFGLYALSGAGKFRRLPLLRTVLLFVAAVYLLRGLLVIPQTPIVLTHPDQVRFVVFSGIALCVGVIHLGGLVQLWRRGRPGEQPQILC
jgi:xanthine/uracil permease